MHSIAYLVHVDEELHHVWKKKDKQKNDRKCHFNSIIRKINFVNIVYTEVLE